VNYSFKGDIHPKILILSSFTHPIVSNLYEQQQKGILKNVGKQTVDGPHRLP